MADDYKDAVLLHSPEDDKKIAEVYEEAAKAATKIQALVNAVISKLN